MNIHARVAFLAICGGLFGLTSGCHGPQGKPPAERPAPQPQLLGHREFAETSLMVSAELGPFQRPRPSGDENGREATDHEAQGRKSGRPSGGRGERPPPGDTSGGARSGARPVRSTPMRQVLTVTVTNPTDRPIRLRVAEVRSILGSFVPVPSTFTLEPGQAQTLETMRANYPVNLDALDLKIRLRTVETNETQVLTLTAKEPPPPPAGTDQSL